MASLEDLIGVPSDEIGDEELEQLIIRGRLAREASSAPKEKKERVAKVSTAKCTMTDEELDEFE